ncbi:hypothetical protein [Verrucosispora sp. WMMD1129]|uniref:hypothetical protein n=1 Tax=Verrucosispora sp. WMMD1129 TaxID=3016093 RepID=UPI00249C2940|nr:hypothetical protein [Verrucosispora sp. WMMD1129]WFE44270.1 hypothetical protein O7624_07940 [Verrucosispora sp. WMMD1129]
MNRAGRPHPGPGATQVIGYLNGSTSFSSGAVPRSTGRVSPRGARQLLDALDPKRHDRDVELMRMTRDLRWRLARAKERISEETLRRRVAVLLVRELIEGGR